MKIKRRNITGPVKAPTEPTGFPDIVAKPKKPMPESRVDAAYGQGNPEARRRIGAVAKTCDAATADEGFNAGDYLTLLRTPYDESNSMEVRYRNRIKNRGTAIVAKCVDCAGTRKRATECMDVHCPLWAFRLGSNPFRRRK